uniref:Putative polya-specific ribonuclease parn n=1 Tax=Triatoma dimidiata TaxID=72491 RepID=A0A0V0G5L2_TRIDM
MDVTNSNFKELFTEIKDVINSASFICLDGEFTGLSNGENVTSFATPSEYYSKLRSGALDFLVVQFGLSAFRKEECGKRYTNKTYNFYLFPRQLNRQARDRRFLCQASSLTFLTEHGFDFNKLFREGIPYLTQSDEDNLKEMLTEKQKWKEANASTSNIARIPVPNKLQNTVDQAVNSIKELLKTDCEKNEVKIEKCSAFVRKLVYQAMNEEIKSSNLSLETQNGVLVARRGVSKEQLEKEKKDKAVKEEEEIEDAVGFSKVIRELSRSGKLIVGHNMLLDICHFINAFLDPLPTNYREFKEMVHTLFPNLVDTKFMCSEQPLSDLVPSTVLEHLLNTVHKSPFILPEIINGEEKCTFNLGKDNQLHNAGYDAFITGICFLSTLHYLECEHSGKQQPLKSPQLQKYLNKLFLMKIPDTYINLEGLDPHPSRDHIFHLTFPKSWTSQQISELFNSFGGVQLWWQSDTTAWVGLHDKSEAKRASKILEGKKNKLPPGVIILSYERYTSTTATSPRPNKRKSLPSSGEVVGYQHKRRKSSTNEHSIETIPEEEENDTESNAGLNKTKSPNNSSLVFPVDHNWD